MLTVIIECQDQEPELAQTLSVLVVRRGRRAGQRCRRARSRLARRHLAGRRRRRLPLPFAVGYQGHRALGARRMAASRRARRQAAGRLDRRDRRICRAEQAAGPLHRIARLPPPFSSASAAPCRRWNSGCFSPKRQALAAAKSGMRLAEFAKGQKPRRLVQRTHPLLGCARGAVGLALPPIQIPCANAGAQ
jgi:hypothetical protein